MADEVKYKVAEDLKMKATLFSGREVVVDISKVSTKDWKAITRPGLTDEEEAAILEKATGISPDDLMKMTQPDYRLVVDLFFKAGTQPLSNPT